MSEVAVAAAAVSVHGHNELVVVRESQGVQQQVFQKHQHVGCEALAAKHTQFCHRVIGWQSREGRGSQGRERGVVGLC